MSSRGSRKRTSIRERKSRTENKEIWVVLDKLAAELTVAYSRIDGLEAENRTYQSKIRTWNKK